MFLKHNLPGIFWAFVILLLCSLPGDDLPSSSILEALQFDKVVHFFMFGILVLLWVVGLRKQYSYPEVRYHARKIVLVMAVAYGAILEGLQGGMFEGRHLEVLDIGANTAGCLAGLVFFRVIYGKELVKGEKARKIF